ncbi:MAG: hypothetical protein RIR69_340 [Actinomycetota bacterium]|jgi:hypothetical protein
MNPPPTHTSVSASHDSLIRVIPWTDPVVEATGYPIDDPYVEMFWLPILGPTATWLARRLVSGLVHSTDVNGYTCDMTDLASALGVSYTHGRHSPFVRALQRCAMFGVSENIAVEPIRTIAVRTMLPRIPHRHLARLPHQLRIAHEDWVIPR